MRVKRGFKARRRRNRVLKLAKGFRGHRRGCYKRAVEAVERSLMQSARGRRARRGVEPSEVHPGAASGEPARLLAFQGANVIEQINQLVAEARKQVHAAQDEKQLDEVRVRSLGKSGSLSGLRKALGKTPPEDRPRVGKLVTEAIAEVDRLIDVKRSALRVEAREKHLHREKLDVTLPGRTRKRGHRHPVSQALDDIIEIFARLG